MEKIKSIGEYQKLAARTCPDLGSDQKNLLHMNLGIDTEIGEFLDAIKRELAYGKLVDVVNLGEEIADICWYVANKARMFCPESWEVLELSQPFTMLEKEFQDYFLSEWIDMEVPYRVTILLTQVISPDAEDHTVTATKSTFEGLKDMVILKYIASIYNLDFFQILTNNIEKLKIRYPEKFTEENALNRDLDSERNALEQ